MSAAKKRAPAAPDMGGLHDDWVKVAKLRQDAGATPPDHPAPAPAAAARPTMTRRSWYVEQEAADALAAAVDDVHYATRVPKHIVASALMRAAAAQADQIAADLKQTTSHP